MPQLNVQEIRNKSKQIAFETAPDEIMKVHSLFNVPPPTLEPIDELTKISFRHDEKMLDYFYFHPDHLGSSSYITNLAGTVSQHMEYLPFGETMVDEHLNSRNSPFKYNGKEFDEETGNYYYGARYYDPKWSIWVSVDPLVEKTMDAYGYCYNNPINLIDPDGKSPDNDYRLLGNGKLQLIQETNDDFDRIYDKKMDKSIKVSKSFIESGIKYDRHSKSDPTTIYTVKDAADTERIFTFISENSHSEFQMQIYQNGDKKTGYISSAYLMANAGHGGYINSENILDKFPNSKLLQDRHTHTDYYEKNGIKLTAHYPSGFKPDGTIDMTSNADRAYRTHFEAKYPGRIPANFELKHTLRPNILIKYTDESYSPKPKKGTYY